MKIVHANPHAHYHIINRANLYVSIEMVQTDCDFLE